MATFMATSITQSVCGEDLWPSVTHAEHTGPLCAVRSADGRTAPPAADPREPGAGRARRRAGQPRRALTPRKRRETASARGCRSRSSRPSCSRAARTSRSSSCAQARERAHVAEIVDLFAATPRACAGRRASGARRARVHDAVPYWEQVLAGLVFMVAGFLATLIFEVMVASDEPEPRNPLFQDGACLMGSNRRTPKAQRFLRGTPRVRPLARKAAPAGFL